MIFRFTLCLIFLMGSTGLFAQFKPHLEGKSPTGELRDPSTLSKPNPISPAVPVEQTRLWGHTATNWNPLPKPIRPGLLAGPQLTKVDEKTGLPIWIRAQVAGLTGSREEQALQFLEALQEQIQVDATASEWEIVHWQEDALGQMHATLAQRYEGLPVFSSQARLHWVDGKPSLLNGRWYPSPALETVQPSLSSSEILQIGRNYLESKGIPFNAVDASLIGGAPQQTASLGVFHQEQKADGERLAYELVLRPNVADRWHIMVDAHSGEILRSYNQTCRLHHDHSLDHGRAKYFGTLPPPGPTTANATDLNGANRSLNTYEEGGTYFLIDASRNEMFNASASDIPNDPVGVIWTIDAFNNSIQDDNFDVGHVTSNNNTWNQPTSVSAHYNAGIAYEYFLNTFNRVSINGSGGNIISVINVNDNGQSMDNAFWNGFAMFYGNGNVAFTPLAGSLDVGGHEMSHGVIEATANLEYMNESGALNESFADIFGAMIDRSDWRLGEDVVNTQYFPSGALRDMANPNQGGNGLNSPGWQPDHVNEQYFGADDNGGVHINSGIPNHAYYLYATAIGKDAAEQVFYRALDVYLVASSQFVDLRMAVIQAAADLYGNGSNQVSAAASAFDQVGIQGSSTPGGGGGNDYQDDLGQNPGEEYLITTDNFQSALYLYEGNGTALVEPLTSFGTISKPSITDDGVAAVYVGSDQRIRAVFFDWYNGTYTEELIQGDPIWRNVAVSRTGTHIAAIDDTYDNLVWVYSYELEEWATYELYNPTYAIGVETGDVLYADVLEFDYTGNYILYDAFNRIDGTFGTDLEYWDIGFLEVWTEWGYWASGDIFKLFTGLPEDISVGDPTFAKNSDYIVALDLIDNSTGDIFLVGANTQTGESDVIFVNSELNVPNYSIDDERMAFNAFDTFGDLVLGEIPLQANKISPAGDGYVLLSDRQTGVYFANGFRPLSVETLELGGTLKAFPNPLTDQLQVVMAESGQDERLLISDPLGRIVWEQLVPSAQGEQTLHLDLTRLQPGLYYLQVGNERMSILKQ